MIRRTCAALGLLLAVGILNNCSTPPTQVRIPQGVRADGGLGMGSGNRTEPDSANKTAGASTNETTASASGLGMGSGN